MKNVVSEVVKRKLCSGCGICAGIGNNCLEMKFDRFGQLIPEVSNCKDCGLCLTVCPFVNQEYDKDAFSLLGDYLESYVGYSMFENERSRGSSGGLVTRIVRTLLEKKMVDGVVVVGRSNRKDRFFEPVIVSDPEQIINYAGSKYYPIEFSLIIRRLKSLNGRYAFIGVPCVVKGLRLIKEKIPYMSEKITFLIGLACGHCNTKNYTSALLCLVGASESDINTVNYRCKENSNIATNYGFHGIMENGDKTKQLNFLDSVIKDIWGSYYFALDACFHCLDHFAQCADISFMDAWLQPYIGDPKGFSIAVVRNDQLREVLLLEQKRQRIAMSVISENEVLQSQRGPVLFKKLSIGAKSKFLFNARLSHLLSSLKIFKNKIDIHVLRLKIYFENAFIGKFATFFRMSRAARIFVKEIYNKKLTKERIVILGHISCRNKGDEAVLFGIIKGLSLNNKKKEIVIFSEDKKYDSEIISSNLHKKGIIVLALPGYKRTILNKIIRKIKFSFSLVYNNEIEIMKARLKKIRKTIKVKDIVIFSAKDLFTECYGKKGLNKWLTVLKCATEISSNVYVWGCSVDSLSKDSEENLKSILEKVKIVTVRETMSFEYIKKIAPQSRSVLVPDPAYILDSSKPSSFRLSENSKKRIGINISAGVSSFAKIRIENYIQVMRQFIFEIINNFNMECLIVPHVFSGNIENDDYELSLTVTKQLNQGNKNIILAPSFLSSGEYKYLIGKCQYFIGARTHTTIAALSQGIPTIAIGYSKKAYGIFNDFYGNQELVIGIEQLSTKVLNEKFNYLFRNEDRIRSVLWRKSQQEINHCIQSWNLIN